MFTKTCLRTFSRAATSLYLGWHGKHQYNWMGVVVRVPTNSPTASLIKENWPGCPEIKPIDSVRCSKPLSVTNECCTNSSRPGFRNDIKRCQPRRKMIEAWEVGLVDRNCAYDLVSVHGQEGDWDAIALKVLGELNFNGLLRSPVKTVPLSMEPLR